MKFGGLGRLANLLLPVFRPQHRKLRQQHPEDKPAWTSSYVESNGISLHFWRTGGAEKPVLILAHGITDYGLNWTSLARELESKYDIIMYDARGHGYSDRPSGPYSLDAHVGDLWGLISNLQLKKPLLMGHSMGGATVASLAARYPDLARAIILEDPADMLAADHPLTPEAAAAWKQRVETDQALGKRRLMQLARDERHPGWTAIEYSRWAASKLMVDAAVLGILDGPGLGDVRKTYAKITVPTLILKADADDISRAKHQQIAGLLGDGRLVHIEGAGHVVRLDRPVETLREIRKFLTSLI